MNEQQPQIDPTDNELRNRVQARREQLERDLGQAPEGSDRAHRIEGKLRDLEQLLSGGSENASDEVMGELESWLATTEPDA
jgi:hypothetical protein